jgi:hypothetical protein
MGNALSLLVPEVPEAFASLPDEKKAVLQTKFDEFVGGGKRPEEALAELMKVPVIHMGSCYCGGIEWEVTGETKMMSVICHCHSCRKRTGSLFYAAQIFPKGSLKYSWKPPELETRLCYAIFL